MCWQNQNVSMICVSIPRIYIPWGKLGNAFTIPAQKRASEVKRILISCKHERIIAQYMV